jgi:2-polyprenyl-3-methyl-5-hydroxy-6-metoxy-1,4-benzoquinol methylase
MNCRFCQHKLTEEFVDMVNAPPSNSFLTEGQLSEPETFYPLKLYVCEKCWLVQIQEYKKAKEIFSGDYVYFSSYSQSWLEHAKIYVDMIIEKLGLTSLSLVIEIACNDGYLLQYFRRKHIPCIGIEPSENTAEVAKEKGIDVIVDFFGERLARQLAEEGKVADLLIGNNVLAHVPNINDFVAGLKIALKPKGVITMEFPHLMRLIERNQFDTIYHEHFSYLSFRTTKAVFAAHELELFDVEELPTHGGSLRIYAKHLKDASHPISSAVIELEQEETRQGMFKLEYYRSFQQKIDRVKNSLVSFLIEKKRQGKKVVAYGAAAKGNTLLNYCGIKKDLLPFVVDASPHKQGKFLPGVHIPVTSEEQIHKHKPDFVLILPWNLKQEISQQLKYIRNWGGQFVVSIPEVHIF